MATNKHAVIRYQALDKCFRNPGKKYYIEDLIEACNEAIYEFSGVDIGIQKRQIFEDIKYMESAQGWSIDLERLKDGRKVIYRYTDISFSINNSLLNESEEKQLKEVLSTLIRFKGMPQFEWIDEMVVRLESTFTLNNNKEKVIEFDQNQYLKGLDLFTDFFHAILYKKALQITYQGFKQEKPSISIFHPYYLKQYNNRWFVFGKYENYKEITNIALDRVKKIKQTDTRYMLNTEIDFNNYFDDIVGVSISENAMVEKVKIRIKKELWPYIESKPIHGSQKVKQKNETDVLIELSVIINYELTAQLFSYGEAVTVLEPLSLVNTLKQKAQSLLKNYL